MQYIKWRLHARRSRYAHTIFAFDRTNKWKYCIISRLQIANFQFRDNVMLQFVQSFQL